MAKKYTRKQVGSLDALNLEQERIKYKAKRIEDGWLDIFQPQQLAINLITGLISRRKKNKAVQPARYVQSPGKKNKKESKMQAVGGSIAQFVKKPAAQRALKKIGISFLRWQAFNLAFFLGRKAVQAIKEKKRTKKVTAY